MPTSDIILGLLILLPGFLAARVFGALVARRPPDAGERLIEALIFELIVVACYAGLASAFSELQPKGLSALTEDSAKRLAADPLRVISTNATPLFALVVLSILTGFLASVAHNYDFPWNGLRKFGLTKQSSRAFGLGRSV